MARNKGAPDALTARVSICISATITMTAILLIPLARKQNASLDSAIKSPATLGPITLREFVELAKKSPGKLDYASPGNGTSNHLGTELFQQVTGIDMVHIAYTGNGPAMIDLIGGQIQMLFGTVVSVAPQARAGRLKALAVTGEKRWFSFPDEPTMIEAGYPGFVSDTFNALFAPAGTPRSIINRLNHEIGKLGGMQEVKDRLALQGAEVMLSTPEELATRVRGDLAKWGKIVRASGIKAD